MTARDDEYKPGQPMPTFAEQVTGVSEERRTPELEARIAEQMRRAAEASEPGGEPHNPFCGRPGCRVCGASPKATEEPLPCPCGSLELIEDEARYFAQAADKEPTAAKDYLRALSLYMDQLATRIRGRMTFADSLRRGLGDNFK